MLPKASDFYYGGLWGKFVNCCWIHMKFRLRVCLNLSNSRGEFELDWARCNKNIAANLFSLIHFTDSRIIRNQSQDEIATDYLFLWFSSDHWLWRWVQTVGCCKTIKTRDLDLCRTAEPEF